MDDDGSKTHGISNLIERVFKIKSRHENEDVTEEEIISMVNEGHEQGVLLASEAEMIHNIFEFGDKDAKDIMIHRKNMVTLDGNTIFRDALQFMKDNNFSRIPVYIDDIDNITGVLHIKDAFDLSLDDGLKDWRICDIDGLIRDVEFIPETMGINTLFAKMQRSKNHMVIVVDEYGQTSGIVSMEDIIEEIVGNIEDEHDAETKLIEALPDGGYVIDGMAPFDDVAKLLSIDASDDEDFDTLNGYLISLIDRIPSDDEHISVDADGYRFKILSVENKMIKSVQVTKLSDSDADTSKDTSSDDKGERMVSEAAL
jgi:putative hemolysin